MGTPPSVPPEIYDLCFEIYATKGWSYEKIAEHLFHKRKIANPRDSSRPVSRATIMRWVRQGSERITTEGAFRRETETVIAGRTLDDLKELLYEQRFTHQVNTLEDVLKFVDMALKIQRERSMTFGTYAPKRREVTHHGELDLKGLDPETEQMLAALEQHVQANRARRQSDGGP
jgi:transposase